MILRRPTLPRRFAQLAPALAAAACLAGCNTTGPSSVAAAPPAAAPSVFATQHYTPQGFKLPEGSGCSGAIARWQAIQANDFASGNVNPSVHKEIQSEIAAASSVCAAGQDAQATAMIAASRRRHGYAG